jgi:hypothetical protein
MTVGLKCPLSYNVVAYVRVRMALIHTPGVVLRELEGIPTLGVEACDSRGMGCLPPYASHH